MNLVDVVALGASLVLVAIGVATAVTGRNVLRAIARLSERPAGFYRALGVGYVCLGLIFGVEVLDDAIERPLRLILVSLFGLGVLVSVTCCVVLLVRDRAWRGRAL